MPIIEVLARKLVPLSAPRRAVLAGLVSGPAVAGGLGSGIVQDLVALPPATWHLLQALALLGLPLLGAYAGLVLLGRAYRELVEKAALPSPPPPSRSRLPPAAVQTIIQTRKRTRHELMNLRHPDDMY